MVLPGLRQAGYGSILPARPAGCKGLASRTSGHLLGVPPAPGAPFSSGKNRKHSPLLTSVCRPLPAGSAKVSRRTFCPSGFAELPVWAPTSPRRCGGQAGGSVSADHRCAASAGGRARQGGWEGVGQLFDPSPFPGGLQVAGRCARVQLTGGRRREEAPCSEHRCGLRSASVARYGSDFFGLENCQQEATFANVLCLLTTSHGFVLGAEAASEGWAGPHLLSVPVRSFRPRPQAGCRSTPEASKARALG